MHFLLSLFPDGVGEVMLGNEEFKGVMDSNSFMAQLKADEAALEEANKFLLVSELLNMRAQEVLRSIFVFGHVSQTA